jgi:hypothetical protein
LIHATELVAVDPTDRFYIAYMLLIKLAHNIVDVAAKRREADANGAAIDARTLMVKIP